MVILNELYARPSSTDRRIERFVSSVAAASACVRTGDARIFVSPLVEGVGSRLLSNRVFEYQRIYTNYNAYTITLNGGSLGSWVDEERS